jgi:hypothetical protein
LKFKEKTAATGEKVPLERLKVSPISASYRPVKAVRRTKTRPHPAGCLLFEKSGALCLRKHPGAKPRFRLKNALVAHLED